MSYLLISRMNQIDPRMIRSRSDGVRSDDRSQRWKVQRLPRRSEDRMVIRLDPIYRSIVLLSLDLVSWRAIPMHVEGTIEDDSRTCHV